MPTRPQLLARARRAATYEEMGREFGIHPGQAYMIATGVPADGSDVLTREEQAGREGLVEGSTQHLVNPGTELPKHKKQVEDWMKGRVGVDLAMRQAAEARTATPPEIEGEGETTDVVSVIGWQHNQVKWLQEQLETVPGVRKGGSETHQQQRVSILDMIRVRLSQHETAEEECFWPAVRDHLEGGDDLAAQALAQEQEGKDLLQELMGLCIEARVLVTPRMTSLVIGDRVVHQIGVPFHWGSNGYTKGDSANDLTSIVLDPNVHIQEVKALTVAIAPGRRPTGSARVELVKEYQRRAGVTENTGTEVLSV